MYQREELCAKITEIYPEIGQCGIDIDVTFDAEKNAWVVDLETENPFLHKEDLLILMALQQRNALPK